MYFHNRDNLKKLTLEFNINQIPILVQTCCKHTGIIFNQLLLFSIGMLTVEWVEAWVLEQD